MQKCDPVAEIRNEAVHPNVISFEEGMVKRRKIIPIINEIIDLIYPDSA
jgi:hypothetical protein